MTVGKPKLVSLLANFYSGATLLTILLGGHSKIVSNGESMFFDDKDDRRYVCTCGQYIDQCDFYQAAASHMRRSGVAGWDKQLFVHVPSFSRNPILRSFLRSWRYESVFREHFVNVVPVYRDAKNRFLEAQLQFFANARRLAGASVYMDGTKSTRRAQLFARDDRCEMKVLHLIRDGRGFCSSYLNHEVSRPTAIDAANAWLSYISQVDGFLRAFPAVPVLSVRYEDLCRSTAETTRAICKFLDIPYEDLSARAMKDTHILGHEMRKRFSGTIVEDTSWTERLDHRTQSTLTSLMRRELERFGYVTLA
jgi:hypothetical protein